MKIYISGVHSDVNPSPGLGVARSLRLAYPSARLIGVDYSTRSTGLNDPVFDDVLIMNGWDEVDLATYISQVERLAEDGFWISGLDLETWLLARFTRNDHILVPPFKALETVKKPSFGELFKTPPFITADSPDEEIYEFFIEHGRDVWVKGPYYEALRARSWRELKKAVDLLTERWGRGVYIQANVKGREVCLAYAAYKGRLLDAVYMRKLYTINGKTWAGEVLRPPERLLEKLSKLLSALEWTGGGELEFIKTSEGLYLVDWNPRFPAWIYGAAIAGHNLPAKLIEEASGVRGIPQRAISTKFVRVVYEIPLKFDFEEAPAEEAVELSKHPSGMPSLARQIGAHGLVQNHGGDPSERAPLSVDLSIPPEVETPRYIFLRELLEERVEKSSEAFKRAGEDYGVLAKVAYSIKTNPSAEVLEVALRNGLLAEAISLLEVKRALGVGFRQEDIILNGPAKFWPRGYAGGRFHAVFADSLNELEQLNEAVSRGDLSPQILGFRVRHPLVTSRFGVDVGDFNSFYKLSKLFAKIPREVKAGLHFQIPAVSIGVENWLFVYKSILRFAKLLEKVSGRRVEVLDVGGGWSYRMWNRVFLPNLYKLIRWARDRLGSLEEFLAEPGRALVEDSFALVARVLEVRKDGVVVDASIAEIPTAVYRPHRVFHYRDGRLYALRKGRGAIFGRTCMEDDVLAEGVDTGSIRRGDLLVFLDVGAYDMSMSFKFGV